ncbi:hypothetical protein HC891_22800 [Candidatus Gracilibacteria bacterium]|nr:hypothetical protein [Candidatus Gracilibacteria bacterium]
MPSRTHRAAITWGDCYIAGTGESGYILTHPNNPDIVYVGAIGSSPGGGNALQRYDHRTGQLRLITTWPEYMGGYGSEDHKYRFAWTYPIVISPHDANTLYIGGNMVFRSVDEGQSWQPISPDLTRADPETLKPTGGPVNRDSIGAEVYATVFALIESPHEAGVLWAGSDDGLLHLSRNGGERWQHIDTLDLPEWTLISCIEPSPFEKGTVYLACTRYKNDDYRPYLYKTSDYGASWQRIDSGIAEHDFTRVIRADPARRGLLYAGTETGLYVSFDDGQQWQRFQLNLPVSPIHDLVLKDGDLIAGTHGRSIWVLDDLSPLQQMSDQVTSGAAWLFKPRTTVRPLTGIDWSSTNPGKQYINAVGGQFIVSKTPENAVERHFLDAGQNPPKGAMITYFLNDAPEQPLKLSIADASAQSSATLVAVPSRSRARSRRANGSFRQLSVSTASLGICAAVGRAKSKAASRSSRAKCRGHACRPASIRGRGKSANRSSARAGRWCRSQPSPVQRKIWPRSTICRGRSTIRWIRVGRAGTVCAICASSSTAGQSAWRSTSRARR